jgi:hypothetical protein
MQRAVGAAGHALARNLLKEWTCCDAFVISRSRVRLQLSSLLFSRSSSSGFIVRAVEALAAEHYRRVISEKTRDALACLRAKEAPRVPLEAGIAQDFKAIV